MLCLCLKSIFMWIYLCSSGGMKGTIKSRCGTQVKEGVSQYRRDCCYILQDDHLAPFFTVSEIMYMATQLKLSPDISHEKKQMLVSGEKS